MVYISDGKGKDSLIDLEDTSETNEKLSGKFSGLGKWLTDLFFQFEVHAKIENFTEDLPLWFLFY